LKRDEMNILITGGTGFLGSHLARQLSGHNIKIAGRGLTAGYLTTEETRLFDFIKCDIRDKGSLMKRLPHDIDLVIHCAGMLRSPKDGRCANELIETNLNSTINLMEVIIDKGIKNFLFCSSMTVYGVKNDIPVKEDGVLKPVHFYGLSKKWAEEAVVNYAREGLLNALILRYPGLYGYPRTSGYMYNTIKKALREETISIESKGLKFWETINIEDAAEITKRVLGAWKWSKNYEIINCSYGEEIDFVGTAFKIKEIINSGSPIEIKQPVEYIKFYLDNSRLRDLMDFDYNFENGLKNFLKKYKKWLRG
jgi:UDP-glucose 4-epimerase